MQTHLKFRILIVLMCLGAMPIAIWQPWKPDRAFDEDYTHIENIRSNAELNRAFSDEYCVIFIDVDWSIYPSLTRDRICELEEYWRSQNRPTGVSFYTLDLSRTKELPDHMTRWLSSEPQLAGIEMSGMGEIILLRRGVIIDVLPAYELASEELIKKTRFAFAQYDMIRLLSSFEGSSGTDSK
jgi:hypothetical protein